MSDFLGFEPPQSVSRDTARSMAKAAYQQAQRLGSADAPLVGLACTAALATDRVRRGQNRCHVAAWDDTRWTAYDLLLEKGVRDREAEEDIASRLVLLALAAACGVQETPDLGLTPGDSLETSEHSHPHPLESLLSGEAGFVTVNNDGGMTVEHPAPAALLPGSFNPLHRGHEALAQAAASILGTDVAYELSVTNVDKPTLTVEEAGQRVSQFQGKGDCRADPRRHLSQEGGPLSRMHLRHRVGHGRPIGRSPLLRRRPGRHDRGPLGRLGLGLPLPGGGPTGTGYVSDAGRR